jgi:hypothetical protein
MNIISKTIKRNEVDYVFTLIEEPTVEMYNDALGTIFLFESGVTKKDIENTSAIASDNWVNIINLERGLKPDAKGNITMKASDFLTIKKKSEQLLQVTNTTLEKSQYQLFEQVCELVNTFTVCEGVNAHTKKELVFGASVDFILFFLKELKELLQKLLTSRFSDSILCLEITEAIILSIKENN